MSYDIKWVAMSAAVVILVVAFITAATLTEISLNDCRSSGFDAGFSVEEINQICR